MVSFFTQWVFFTRQKGQNLLRDYIPILCEDRAYSLQDLLFIPLYQISLGTEDEINSSHFDVDRFLRISRNLLKSMPSIPFEYLFLLRDALMTIPIVEFERKEFQNSKQAIELLNEIMIVTQDFKKTNRENF